MKQGIHLGEKVDLVGRRGWLWVVWIALLATLAHGVSVYHRRANLDALRAQVASLESELETEDSSREALDQSAIERLSLLARSGVSVAPSMNDFISLLAESLPAGLEIQTVSLLVSDRESLARVLATADHTAAVALWQSRLERDERIARTELLEERFGPSGQRAVQIRIELTRLPRPASGISP